MEDARLITPRSAEADLNSIYPRGKLLNGADNGIENGADCPNNVGNETGEAAEDGLYDCDEIAHGELSFCLVVKLLLPDWLSYSLT